MKKYYLLLIFLLLAGLTSAQSYFVSPAGNDSNNGSQATPWLSIQHGLDQLTPGDTLEIMAGTYGEKLDLDASGTPGQMITIRAFQNQNVTVDAVAISNSIPIFYAENQSHIRVRGLHFTNCYDLQGAGFNVEGYGDNWELLDCKFSNIAISTNLNHPVTTLTNMPIVLFSGSASTDDSLTNILIRGCEVFDCRPGFSECIAVSGNLSGFTIEDNLVHDNKNIGIAIGGNYNEVSNPVLDHGRHGVVKNNICHHNLADYSESAGIYVDGGEHVVVENNFCYNNGQGGEIGCEETGNCSYITFRNNVFYNNRSTGMHVGGYDAGTGGFVEHSKVYNNTFYHNDSNGDGNGELLLTQFENGEIHNNIFYLSAHGFFMSNDRSQPNLSMNHNLVYGTVGPSNVEAFWNGSDLTGLAGIYTTTATGGNDSWGNPQFTNPANGDFHIGATSPAVNAGNPAFVPAPDEVDLDGQGRVYNGQVDCGADEYSGVTAIGGVLQSHHKLDFSPNPTHGSIHLPAQFNHSAFEVYSLNGKFIKAGQISQESIDLSDLGQKIYLVKIKDRKTKLDYFIKVVKQ